MTTGSGFSRREFLGTTAALAVGGCIHGAVQQTKSLRAVASAQSVDPEKLRKDRRAFCSQEITTAAGFMFIFNPGEPPRLVWRDAEAVRRLGGDPALSVRWFDADLNEVKVPKQSGRWGAYIQSRAPNGTIVRRAMTFFCRPASFLLYFPQIDAKVDWQYQPGPIAKDVWQEHQREMQTLMKDGIFHGLDDSEAGAILIAGLSEAHEEGHPVVPDTLDSAVGRNGDYHFRLKQKVMGLAREVKPIKLPIRRSENTSRREGLIEGSEKDAGVREGASEKIAKICEAWAKDSGEPFATLVARRGVIVMHRAFGMNKESKPIDLDYRAGVASITKTVTALMFARFVDQGLIALDDRVSKVFSDWPDDPKHVPTFRQCLTHMSGMTGHGDFGGVNNPHLENIILNGIDANEPGKKYDYSGMGFDLTASAMEIVAGKTFRRLYRKQLFQPLGMGDVPMADASAGAHLTAKELATIAQVLLSRGRFGDVELMREQTFAKLMPQDLSKRYPGVKEVEGIGMHWMPIRLPGKDANRLGAPILSERTLGHGSLSGCIMLADLDHELVIGQARQGQGERYGEWSTKFYQAIAEGIV